MAAVRRRDTTAEVGLRRALHAAGVRGWRCDYAGAPGRPDLAWPALRVAVFCDGAFWHGHPSRFQPGRSCRYWDEKIARNVARDRRVDAELKAMGWTVLRIWDFDLKRDMEQQVEEVVGALLTRIAPNPSGSQWKQSLRSAAGVGGAFSEVDVFGQPADGFKQRGSA
jgi:DNA mismatch endonuclease (patch repair protein)